MFKRFLEARRRRVFRARQAKITRSGVYGLGSEMVALPLCGICTVWPQGDRSDLHANTRDVAAVGAAVLAALALSRPFGVFPKPDESVEPRTAAVEFAKGMEEFRKLTGAGVGRFARDVWLVSVERTPEHIEVRSQRAVRGKFAFEDGDVSVQLTGPDKGDPSAIGHAVIACLP